MTSVPSTAARRLAARVRPVVWAAERWYGWREQQRAETRRRADRRALQDLAIAEDLRLNVGSSDNVLEGWLNLDLRPGGSSLQMDATEPWPFRDGSAVAVNSEHFIEHLPAEDAAAYLREAFRVLRPGGIIRTSTPDLGGLCCAFLQRDPRALEVHRSHGYEARTHGDMVNNYVYLWDHRHIWDFESLKSALEDVGFTGVEQAEFNRSSHHLLGGIDRHDPDELAHLVLWVDAVRP